jgi:alanine dehydrogenase
MRVGTTKEIKIHEYRVGLVPASVRELVRHGHEVVVETKAGNGIGFDDDDYRAAGATILGSAAEVFEQAEMIVKVKEPQPRECDMLREGQILFTYLHLAADAELTRRMAETGCIGIAYETVTDRRGGLPLLTPMSEVAGRMSIQVGAHYLEKAQGGAGVLLGGVPGVPPGKVCILGAGVSGSSAAAMAVGLGAEVTVLNRSVGKLIELDRIYRGRIVTATATAEAVERFVVDADLVVGAILVPGAAAPKVVTAEMVEAMCAGSVIVDISIDQGGCCETSRPTTHAEPVYVERDVIHYCVTNMPGALARTSTFALNNATLPYSLALADKGYKQALADDSGLRAGLNIHAGKVTYAAVARDVGLAFTPADEALAA